MDLVGYQKKQHKITQRIVKIILGVFDTVSQNDMTDSQWRRVLDLVFPEVRDARTESAELARAFYDSERSKANIGDWPVELPPKYRREWFYDDMEAYRPSMVKKGSNRNDVTRATMGASKIVENAGRRTIFKAIEGEANDLKKTFKVNEDDYENSPKFSGASDLNVLPREERSGIVLGWARVATGAETCSWCMMMVSRGPVYHYSGAAGGQGEDDINLERYFGGQEIPMNKWHPNCDCKIVPVFNQADWPGRDRYIKALGEWERTTKHFDGKDKARAFRRAYESGDIDLGFAKPVAA